MNNVHIQHQNMVFLKATFNFYQTKLKKFSLFFLNRTQMSAYHQNLIQHGMYLT